MKNYLSESATLGHGAGGLSRHSLHDLLRSATGEVHERLHGHRGLAAVKAGTIGRAEYTALLARLYGFYRPFEVAAGVPAERTDWLHADLAVFGVDRAMCLALPCCLAFPKHASRAYVLGAHYVVEGSALGGRGLARQLDALLGPHETAGRAFLNGHGVATGSVWRAYLTRLSAAPDGPGDQAAVIEGAVATFAIFEQWLQGWDSVDA